MNTQRIDRVRANLQARDLDQLLIVDPLSIWWLTGYYTEPYERLLALYLPRIGVPTLFVNRLFPDASNTGARIVPHSDTDDPIPMLSAVIDPTRPLGVDKELSARWPVPPGAGGRTRLSVPAFGCRRRRPRDQRRPRAGAHARRLRGKRRGHGMAR